MHSEEMKEMKGKMQLLAVTVILQIVMIYSLIPTDIKQHTNHLKRTVIVWMTKTNKQNFSKK